MISGINYTSIDNINKVQIRYKESRNLNFHNQKLRTKVHKHDPTKFPNIYFSKKKAQHNFCSFRLKCPFIKFFINITEVFSRILHHSCVFADAVYIS